MSIPIFQVDAFTNQPLSGNPAAVCMLTRPAETQWMQEVASEMNLSETAFVHPQDDGWALRWFTPIVEVDLCGHATLATAHTLWETQRLPDGEPAIFHTKSGTLTCVRRDDWIEMDFPATPATPINAPEGLLESLGVGAAVVGKSKFDYLVQIDSEHEVRTLSPDYATLKHVGARAVIVTARASGDFDFVSRFFAPQSGIDEDPVTGSAHCCLGPWWRHRLGKDRMVGYQASPRGGVVRVAVNGNRILLSGQAVTTIRGELIV